MLGLKSIDASSSSEKSLKVPLRGTFKLFSGFHVSAKRCIHVEFNKVVKKTVKSSIGTDYISFLPRLREGDRVTYGGTQWEVKDFSTYADAHGYETMEWLLRSNSSSHYLLREVDPDHPETNINWYLSEEIEVDRLSGERVGDNMRFALWNAMHDHLEPYPTLRAMGRLYYFESETTGTYKGADGDESRTTWDYWDEEHLWNLAIEAWRDREIHVYSTKKVIPEDFAIAVKSNKPESFAAPTYSKSSSQNGDRTWQWVCAWGLVIAGFILMMSGDW